MINKVVGLSLVIVTIVAHHNGRFHEIFTGTFRLKCLKFKQTKICILSTGIYKSFKISQKIETCEEATFEVLPVLKWSTISA